MEEKSTYNPYARLNLRDQLYREARAMAEYALADGNKVPAAALKTIESFTVKDDAGIEEEAKVRKDMEISELVVAHGMLVKIVEPAKPRTILLLDMEQKAKGFFKFLGPVSLIRQMMGAAILSLTFFVMLAMTEAVSEKGGNIMSQFGPDLLLNLLFYLAAAGLGASFAGLYTANSYITKGTFDPTYHASYWIRFFLGLIAGLVLAVMVSEEYFKMNVGGDVDFLEKGIVRPLLAMLGGFSADLTYTILSRLVETFQSLFMGSAKNQITAKEQELKANLAEVQSQQQVSMASNLVNLQQAIGVGAKAEDVKKKINDMIVDVMPGAMMESEDSLEDAGKV
ncbi:MAG: hypothetical protein OEV42_02555 [Deltaproteobacteria bacterium]|nr:hypothetical protein [Deltaproteobacteria bacterium]